MENLEYSGPSALEQGTRPSIGVYPQLVQNYPRVKGSDLLLWVVCNSKKKWCGQFGQLVRVLIW